MDKNGKDNNQTLVYRISSSSEDQKQNKYGMNKNDELKKLQQQTEISENRPIQKFTTTSIIRISPSSKNIYSPDNQNQNKQIINLQYDQSEDINRNQSQIYESQCDSPVKLKRQKRKNKSFSNLKSIQIKNKPYIYDDTQQRSKSQQQNLQHVKNPSNLVKIPSQYEINDTQRHFDIKKELKPSQMEISVQFQSQKINKNHFIQEIQAQDSEQYEDSDQMHANYDSSSQEQQMMQSSLRLQSQGVYMKKQHNKNAIKIIKQSKEQIFVQAEMQSLILSQIPHGLRICCLFIIQKKYFGMSTQYNLVIKQTRKVILSAKKQHFSFTNSKFIISTNQNYITKRKDNNSFLGFLQSNFSGTTYDLFLRKQVNNKRHKQSKYEEQQENNIEQQLIQQIQFQKNLWGYQGVRNLNVIKVDKQKLSKKDIQKNSTLQDIIERKQMSKIISLSNKKPKYDKNKKKYVIDFQSKVKVPSNKNLILLNSVHSQKTNPNKQKINQDSKNVNQNNRKIDKSAINLKSYNRNSLLIAKQSQSQYLVQISHPFSIFQAFGVCLANNDSKLLVN